MQLIHAGGLERFRFSTLSSLPGFFHGIFVRDTTDGRGGRLPFNLGPAHGSPEAVVRSNREKMLASFGPGLSGVYGRQVHGKDVGVFNSDKKRKHRGRSDTVQLNGDALVTDVAGAALVILVADCQPVLIIDPVKKVVANIHSGWRGSIQNIIGATLHQMVRDFGCRPQDLICGIGPSLGPCCAEFVHHKDEIPAPFRKYRHGKCHFDFWQASKDQLAAAGVKPDNISVSGLCTRCNPHLFFSYRAEKQTGRFAAVVGIEPEESGDR